MKLTTVDILALFQAHQELAGRPVILPGPGGQPSMVREPYDLGPKFIWNAGKNLGILRRHAEDHDNQLRAFMGKLRAAKRKLEAAKDSPADVQAKHQEEINAANDEIRNLAKGEIEVSGLLKLPASGLNLKTSRLPPTVIEGLMLLIDGEPEFPAEEPAKK